MSKLYSRNWWYEIHEKSRWKILWYKTHPPILQKFDISSVYCITAGNVKKRVKDTHTHTQKSDLILTWHEKIALYNCEKNHSILLGKINWADKIPEYKTNESEHSTAWVCMQVGRPTLLTKHAKINICETWAALTQNLDTTV